MNRIAALLFQPSAHEIALEEPNIEDNTPHTRMLEADRAISPRNILCLRLDPKSANQGSAKSSERLVWPTSSPGGQE